MVLQLGFNTTALSAHVCLSAKWDREKTLCQQLFFLPPVPISKRNKVLIINACTIIARRPGRFFICGYFNELHA